MSERELLKISTRVMYDELLRQGAEVRILDAAGSLLEFTDLAGKPRLLFSTSSDKSSAVGLNIAGNKAHTELVAKELGITVPVDTYCHSLHEAEAFFALHNRIVLKPSDNSGGTGVSTNITDHEKLKKAYHYARGYGNTVIAQEHIAGTDVRLLVIGGTFRSAVERRPASVVGDGTSTLKELISKANKSELRQANSMSAMDLIDVIGARRYLADDITNVPAKGEVVTVVGPANLSLGGTAHEATQLVTQAMIQDAEKITRKLGLGICGVDMMWDQSAGTYFLIEVNATPGVNMHNDPFWGTSGNAIEHYVSWLITPGSRIATD